MAMLAEPRRRKKYNLCPRGKALYEDDSRFGTKMLEKMGWTKGRGLGAKEDGSQEFVRVRFKNDAEGLGFEMRDDQWTEHEEGFNGLLKALNGGDTNGANDNADNGNASASEEEARPMMGFGFKPAAAAAEPEEVKPKTLKEKISGVSLEEKSKYSKARVHYKKFTRGKDLAQYSEKDLANIFGKKVNDELTAPIVDTPPEQAVEEEKPINPNFAGVQTVSTGLSVSDYFKQKMEAMKNRLSNIASSNTIETNSFLNGAEAQTETVGAQGSEEDKNETTEKKKKKKDKKKKQEEAEIEQPEETVTEKKKKKKSKRDAEDILEETNPPKRKKKENKQEAEETQTSAEEVEKSETPKEIEPPKKKSKKSKRDEKEVTIDAIEPTEITEVADVEAKKKKKKKTKQTEEAAAETPTVEPVPTEETALKPKNKSKKILEVQDLTQDEPHESTIATESTEVTEESTKKKKKNKKSKQTEANPVVEPEPAEETVPKTKKKSKKTGEAPLEVLDLTQDDQTTATNVMEPSVVFVKPKKSKKKQKTEVSANGSDDKSDSEAEAKADAQNYLTMDELIQKLDSYNEFTISSFCAEKFHTLNMNAFKNSTLAQITGYTFDDNIKLKILDLKDDERRILDLWAGNKSKYDKVRTNQLRTFKKRYMRLKPADIKRLSQIKAFSGI